jgi:replication factor C large subunit
MQPWTKKYRPKNTEDLIGQALATNKIRKDLSTKKPLLLYGPTGTGKTSSIHALGKEKKLEVFELNSSDIRNKAALQSVMGSSIQQQSLFAKGKIILVDDIDALSGTKDRGGISTVVSLIKDSKHPIVLTCTDPWIKKLSGLRKKCNLVEFQRIKRDQIYEHLKNICEKESVQFKEEDLNQLAKESEGDIRAAINDLQTHSINKILCLEDKGERNKHEDINYCLRKIFKSKKWDETHNIFYKVDMDINECMLWLTENLPREYDSEALKIAYDRISRADVFNGRIRRWQHWRFLSHMSTLITSGIAFAKTETNPNFTPYKRSERILKLWLAKQRNAKKWSICEKIAEHTHTSKKQAFKSTFPYLKNILANEEIKKQLELSDDEIAWLKK